MTRPKPGSLRIALILAFCVLAPASDFILAQSPAVIPQPTKPLSMLKGKSLDGWTCYPKEFASDWKTLNGKLIGQSRNRESYLTWTGGGEFRNFDIQLHYRIMSPEANSGLQLRSKIEPEREDHPLVGYQADFGHLGLGENVVGAWDFHGVDRGDVFAKRGTKVTIAEDGKRTEAVIPNAVQEVNIRPKKWNKLRVHAYGDHLTYFLNGKVASEVIDRETEKLNERGYFGLQLSRGQNMRVEFRGLRVQNRDAKPYKAELIESVTLKEGIAEQGVALTPEHYFASDYRTIYRYDYKWNFSSKQEINVPNVNHVGALHHHDGFLWTGMLQGPVDGVRDRTKDRGVIAKISAKDLSVVKTWDVSSEVTWIDPVCFHEDHLYVGDASDQGIHIYRLDGEKLKRVRKLRYPPALHFSQGIRVRGRDLYSIHTFGSEKGLFCFSLDDRPNDLGFVYPGAVWPLQTTGMQHFEGFDFVPDAEDEIWHAQGKQVDRYRLEGMEQP